MEVGLEWNRLQEKRRQSHGREIAEVVVMAETETMVGGAVDPLVMIVVAADLAGHLTPMMNAISAGRGVIMLMIAAVVVVVVGE